jgi:aminopeptidase N
LAGSNLAGGNWAEALLRQQCSYALKALNVEAEAATSLVPKGYRPFPLPGDKPHYAPDRDYTMKHIQLDLTLDFPSKSLSGVARLVVQPVNDGLQHLSFDAAELNVKAVWLENKTVDHLNLNFEIEGEKLKIDLGSPFNAQDELTVAVDYNATPRKGLYFIAPDAGYPDKKIHAWSQGQDTDNHFWFPCYDAPNQKCTSEMLVTVPQEYFALSNGELVATSANETANTKTYHWKQAIPHASYLITLVSGEFIEIEHEWQDIPVQYYVLPNRESQAELSLGNTPAMVKFFSEKIGYRYPYEKYATVCVSDFIFGGMENTTATTLTDTTLHDERTHQDFSSDPLLAHELAHQWFGDLLTCRDWSNGWLNEGFATYFESLWTEHHLGRDEFIYSMQTEASIYFSEDRGHYRRPIVAYTFNQPIDLFDRHLYQKGSLVLHMIRYLLGDQLWWKAINYYVNKHKGQNVITADLERAIEEATGRNLQAFFDQWVYKAGYPQFKLEYNWDETNQTAKLTVKQTQPVDDDNPIFTLPVEIAFAYADKEREVFKVALEEKEQNFYFRLKQKPLFTSFDPSNWILKTVEFNRPKEMLLQQLKQDSEIMGRIGAAQDLAKQGTADALAALADALKTDGFWAVQVEIARSLGTIRSNAAQQALLDGLAEVKHPKVRRAIVAALGEFKDEISATALQKILAGDVTDFVEMEAAVALGKTRVGTAFDTLSANLERESFNHAVRVGIFNGLSELKDERAIPIALEWSAYGKPVQARDAAVVTLGQLGKLVKDKEKDQILDRLLDILENDLSWRTRMVAIGALQGLGEPRAVSTLQRRVQSALDGREIRRSREAISVILDSRDKNEDVKKLREDLDKILNENRELRDRLESLEQRSNK